ncbi:MAG: Sir2 family NAD-dependent protein deacetylase [Gemmatales bacterium]
MLHLSQAAALLRHAQKVTVFTGAGISAESGIPTFRDDTGLWREFPPEKYAHWKGLMAEMWKNPGNVARFILAVVEPIARATPNAAHRAIAQLTDHKMVTVITQNIDNLHQEAGNIRVREVHGSLFKIIDRHGKFVRRLSKPELLAMVDDLHQQLAGKVSIISLLRSIRRLLGLSWRGMVRPSIVLFHENMAEPDWKQANEDVEWCDLMIVVGTSAEVYPACSLPLLARRRQVPIIEVNPVHAEFQGLWLQGTAVEVMPQLVNEAIQ